MQKKLLMDTDIVIDYLRNQTSAVHYLEQWTDTLFLSVVTVAEIYAGVRDQNERKTTEIFLSAFSIIPLDNTIAVAGGEFCKKYKKSHGTGLADALIAATALHYEANLVTLNARHYPMLKTIKPYEK